MAKDLSYGRILDLDMETLQNYGNDDSVATASGTTIVVGPDGSTLDARSFNGSSDNISCGNDPISDGDVTFSIDVKFDSISGYQYVLSSGGQTGSIGYAILQYDGTLFIARRESSQEAATGYFTPTGGLLVADTWYNITGIYDVTSGEFKTYINGDLQNTTSITSASYTNLYPLLKIGIPNNISGSYLNGSVTKPKLWSRVITENELDNYLSNNITPNDDLVFDLNMGSLQNEASAQAYEVTATGTTLTTDKDGRLNKARSFNGTSDSIHCDTTSMGYNSRTYGMNFKVGTVTATTALIWDRDYFNDGACVYLGTSSTGILRSVFEVGGSQEASSTSLLEYDDDEWHTLIAVFERGVGQNVYIDGGVDPVCTGTCATGDVSHTAGTTIGKYGNGSGGFFPGDSSKIDVWDYALSEEERALYFAESKHNYVGLFDGLVLGMDMNGDAKDFSGNENDGTVTGATLTTDEFGIEDSALLFDGNDYIQLSDKPPINLFSALIKFKTTSTSGELLVDSDDSSSANYGFLFHQNVVTVGKLSARLFSGVGGSFLTLTSTTTTNDGNWHTALFTWDGTTGTDGAKLYIDGNTTPEDTSTAPRTISVDSTYTPRVGRGANFVTGYFNGTISNLLYWDIEISSSKGKSIHQLLSKGDFHPYPQHRQGGITE